MAHAASIASTERSELRFTAIFIELWPVDRLVPYVRNAPTHSDEQVAQIAASIKEVGFVNPILVGRDRIIVTGHASEVPVIVLDGLTEINVVLSSWPITGSG